jgi:hypothetical protein
MGTLWIATVTSEMAMTLVLTRPEITDDARAVVVALMFVVLILTTGFSFAIIEIRGPRR